MAAASLPAEQQAAYTVIIDGILATADLDNISVRKIRDALQKAVQYDITPQKDAIKELIMQRFDKFFAEQETQNASQDATAQAQTYHAKPVANGKESTSATPPTSKRKADSEESDSVSMPSAASPPPKKKVRKVEDMDTDAALAAKLQAEENARSRPTRGGNPRKAAPTPKKKAKKKSKSKVNAEDDSDVEGSATERKVNRNSGFHKPLILSPALSNLLGGETKLSRPQATKKLWAYIKANELQEPSDKRIIRCDDALKAVFKVDSIGMFKMTKAMNQNMYNDEE